MAHVHSVVSSWHGEALRQFVQDADLRQMLASIGNRTFLFARSSDNPLWPETPQGVQDNICTTIKLGYYRALAYRYLQEVQNVNPRLWLLQERKQAGSPAKHSRDRSQDTALVRARFPEYEQFIPSRPLTLREVYQAARQEVADLYCAPGSDHHFTRVRLACDLGVMQNQRAPLTGALRTGVLYPKKGTRTRRFADRVIVEFTHPDDGVVHSRAFQNLDDETFSPTILRIARHFVQVFGLTATMYWVWDKMFFRGDYAHLLRVFGGDHLEQTDPVQFEATKRDLIRRIKLMDAELPNLAGDLQLQMAHDALTN